MNEEIRCIWCGEKIDINDFKDKSSKEEFRISGLCQDCQDETFEDVEE